MKLLILTLEGGKPVRLNPLYVVSIVEHNGELWAPGDAWATVRTVDGLSFRVLEDAAQVQDKLEECFEGLS